jgi:Fur family ferric uptake transcriptional regulator
MTEAPARAPLAFEEAEEVVRALRRAGHRVSAPARMVLDALFAAEEPVSAERIAGGLDGALPELEATSVYRNLERFQQLGVVSHVHVGHGPGLYALARGRDREYLVCVRCGAVRAVEHEALDQVRALIAAGFGYQASFSHFPIHGVCASCAAEGGHMAADEHRHGDAHSHEHDHDGVTHSHPHTEHDHEHTEHEHEHRHGDVVHSHRHVHQEGLEEDHEHGHDGD